MAMTPERLAEIRTREQAATAGPWTVNGLHVESSDFVIANFEVLADTEDEWAQMARDAEFSAHARTDVSALLADVEQLTAIVYPTPAQMTAMEMEAAPETVNVVTDREVRVRARQLASHVRTLAAALREHDARLVASEDRCAAEVAAVREELTAARDALAKVTAERDLWESRAGQAGGAVARVLDLLPDLLAQGHHRIAVLIERTIDIDEPAEEVTGDA